MLEHLERLLLTDDVDVIWSEHCNLMAQYGFDRLIYAFMPFRSTPGYDDIADSLVLSSHDEDYLKVFLQGGLFLHAPMVNWTTRSTGAQSWSWVWDREARGELSPEEQNVVNVNRSFGVSAGYSIAFADSSQRAKGGIGLCAERGLSQDQVDDIWARHGRELMVVNSVLHLRISTMPIVTSRRLLTDRQRQVLEWVADGKTTADIALIMGLTPATIEKHLRLAREVLDVETTAQAVLKASMQKQLFLTGDYQQWFLRKRR